MPEVAAATGSRRVNIKAKEWFVATIDAPGMTPDSNVVGSITEIDVNGNPQDGDAAMTIHNVVPQHNRVLVKGYVDYFQPLSARVTILFQ